MGEERAVERQNGVGVGEIDRVTTGRVRLDEGGERRMRRDQSRKIVRRAMQVARMQFPPGVVGLFLDGFQSAGSQTKPEEKSKRVGITRLE